VHAQHDTTAEARAIDAASDTPEATPGLDLNRKHYLPVEPTVISHDFHPYFGLER
jgi:hypothetical protein